MIFPRLAAASMKHRLLAIMLIATLILFFFSTFTGTSFKEYNETRPYLGAYVTIRCFFDKKSDIKPVIKKCWDRMNEIQVNMNMYSDAGDVAMINRMGKKGVDVNNYTYDLLARALELSRKTEGAFDVTVGPLVRLWKDAERNDRMPTEAELADAIGKVGYENIDLTPPNHVLLAKNGMKVDLGGMASGYACDEIAKILKANGVENALVDAGGEILCFGSEGGRKPWLVGIQDPEDKNNIIGTIEIKDRSVSTSGSYEKSFIIGGEKFSHILNPITGMPGKSVVSATVIAPAGVEADALSTALCALGAEKGLALIRDMKDVEAMVIEKVGEKFVRHQTDNFGK